VLNTVSIVRQSWKGKAGLESPIPFWRPEALDRGYGFIVVLSKDCQKISDRLTKKKEIGMNTSNYSTLIAQDLAAIGWRIPSKPVQFESGEVTTQPELVPILPPGRWLRVQPNQCALITHPTGRVLTCPTGEHYLRWSASLYTLQFYDLRQQTSYFPEIRSVSSDAWDVEFNNMQVLWKVLVPAQIMHIPNPRAVVEAICRSAVINFIRTTPHDELVSTPGELPLATVGIADQIKSALIANPSLSGFEIMAVLIMEIKGDRRRTEVVQKSIVRKTEIDQDVMIQREQARLAGEKLKLEQEFANRSQALALKKAETKRLEAEEEERLRLRKAEITAIEAKTARDAQLQAVQIQQLAEQQRMQHEQIMKAMEVRGQAFGQLASAIFQMTNNTGGIQRGFDGNNQETLVRALEALANMPTVSFGTTPMLSPQEEDRPMSLHDRIVAELHQVQKLPGTESAGTKEIEPGFEQVEILFQNLHIFIVCGEDYPNVRPIKIEAQQSGTLTYKQISLEWVDGMNLRQIVLEVASRLLSNKYINTLLKNNGNGNGHKNAKSLAV
jgi:hypothetical protein